MDKLTLKPSSAKEPKQPFRVFASDNIGDNMLILYQDLLKFHIIPFNFSYKVFTCSVSIDILESIKQDFADVLTDRINQTSMKTDKPMEFHLREDARTLSVLAARRVPTRYKDPVEAVIEDLIYKEVLQRIRGHRLVLSRLLCGKEPWQSNTLTDFTVCLSKSGWCTYIFRKKAHISINSENKMFKLSTKQDRVFC